MNSLLKWEHDWIDANRDRYDPPEQADRVKRRIEYRYWETARAREFRKVVDATFPELKPRKAEQLVDAMIGDIDKIIRINVSLISMYVEVMLHVHDHEKINTIKNTVGNYVAKDREYLNQLFGA